MLLTHLRWYEFDNEDNHAEYQVLEATWQNVEEALVRLDGQRFPCVCLAANEKTNRFPRLTIIGGAGGYSATLELADENGDWTGESLQSINPELFWTARGYVAIGKGYHNYEIDEAHLVTDFGQVLKVVQHFSETGKWNFGSPQNSVKIEKGKKGDRIE